MTHGVHACVIQQIFLHSNGYVDMIVVVTQRIFVSSMQTSGSAHLHSVAATGLSQGYDPVGCLLRGGRGSTGSHQANECAGRKSTRNKVA